MLRAGVLLHYQWSIDDIQQLLAWYKIRDTLLGQNWVEQDVKKALVLAAVCEHHNAVWLTKLFAGREVNRKEDARQVFLSCENDPRALCFAAFLGGSNDEFRRTVDLGDALAQAWMAKEMIGEEKFRWAEKSASQGERNGFYQLGRCYRDGIGCESNMTKAKKYFLISAELGHIDAMRYTGDLLEKTDPQRFFWFGKAAATGGDGRSFLYEMDK